MTTLHLYILRSRCFRTR